MTEADYRKAEGLSSSLLSDFAEAPDIALMPKEDKIFFDEGKAFEMLVMDFVRGTNEFESNFFVVHTDQKPPTDFLDILNARNFEDYYVYNKNGSLSKAHTNLHFYLDACKANPGLRPIRASQYCMLDQMTHNFFKMEVEIMRYNESQILKVPMETILVGAKFQVAQFWETDAGETDSISDELELSTISKKALFDIIVPISIGQENWLFHFDIKTTADLKRFPWMYRDKYWIQDLHYTEGLRSLAEDKYPDHSIHHCMNFLVSSKQMPYLSQTFGAPPENRNKMEANYQKICQQCYDWDKAGRPPKGWRERDDVSYNLKEVK